MELAINLLKFGIAFTMIIYGIHQLWKPAEWVKYLPKWLRAISSSYENIEIRLHGVGNILIGTWLISGFFPLIGAWLTFIWWLTILPTIWKVDWTSFFRDITIICAVGAYISLIS